MRRTPLLARPPADRTGEPGYREWHQPIRGACALCGRRGPLERHHIVTEQTIRREGRIDLVWDLRNALPLGRYCRCHARHTNAVSRIPRRLVPPSAVEFAVELLGEPAAEDYLRRYYC